MVLPFTFVALCSSYSVLFELPSRNLSTVTLSMAAKRKRGDQVDKADKAEEPKISAKRKANPKDVEEGNGLGQLPLQCFSPWHFNFI